MTIKTRSAFNYGHRITLENRFLNFNEGSGELTATLKVGFYSLGGFAVEISRAMNESGTNSYTVTVNRGDDTLTITGTGTFVLLAGSGSQVTTSPFSLMGFAAIDTASLSAHTGESRSGFQYRPQFLLQSFLDFNDNKSKLNPSINQSASGKVEVVSFGDVRFMTCNITLATDIQQGGKNVAIENNPTGIADLRSFMEFIIDKGNIEFIPDRDNPSVFTTCFLESTPTDAKGVSYELKELYTRGLAEYFETGILKFRKI